MRSRTLIVGLSGFGVAVGSVCRPRTTALSASVSLSTADLVTFSTSATGTETSIAATASTTDETLLSSLTSLDTGFSFTKTALRETESTNVMAGSTTRTVETSLLSTTETSSETSRPQTSTDSTATTLETSIVVTSSVDISSTSVVKTVITSGDTSLLTTTEATTLETSIAVTTSDDISTTTLAETTTTSESPSIPTAFLLTASTGPKAGKMLKLGTYSFASASFDEFAGTPPLSWVPETGNLRVRNGLFLCVLYNTGVPGAELISCNSNTLTTSLLICEAPAGRALKCKAPDCWITFSGMTGPQRVCAGNSEPWTQFYIKKHINTLDDWHAAMGRDISDPDYTPIEFKIQQA